jgi:hypothetical protein
LFPSINTAIGDNTTAITTKVSKAGDTMNGLLTMDNANIDLINGSVIQQGAINTYQSLQQANPTNIVTGSTASSMTSNNNSGYGWLSLDSSQTGDNNTAYGAVSLKNLTTGARNTAVGMTAGGSVLGTDITTENDNVLIGYGTSGIGFNNSITIGSAGVASKSNQCTIHGVTEIVSGSDNTCDLGSSTRRMKNIYLSGNAIAPTAPTLSTHLANKQYVDNQDSLQVSKTGDDMSGNLNLTGTAVYQIDSENIHNIIDKGNNNLISKGGGGNISSGQDNIGLGVNVLGQITTQNRQIAIGTGALNNNTGFSNVAIGFGALSNGSAEGNFALGDATMVNATTAAGCVAIGCGALFYNESGNNNISLGCFSGEEITTQSENILIGESTRTFPYSSCIVLGKQARSTKSNQFIVNNISEFVCQSDNQMDLGSTAKRMRDLHLGGSIYIDGTINGLGVIGNLFTQTATSATHSTQTTPTSILSTGVGSLTIGANTLVAGSSLRFKLGGIMTCGNGDELTLTFLGYTTPNISCDGATGDGAYELECEIVIRGVGASASMAINWNFAYYNNGGSLAGTAYDNALTTINTTIANNFDVVCVLVNSGMEINSTMLVLDKSR